MLTSHTTYGIYHLKCNYAESVVISMVLEGGRSHTADVLVMLVPPAPLPAVEVSPGSLSYGTRSRALNCALGAAGGDIASQPHFFF